MRLYIFVVEIYVPIGRHPKTRKWNLRWSAGKKLEIWNNRLYLIEKSDDKFCFESPPIDSDLH